MKNQMKIITTILGVLLLLSSVSALDLNAGECSILDIQVEGEVTWTEIEGMYITQNGTEIEICLDILFETTNYTLSFYNEQEEIIIYQSSGGGGGGGSGGTRTIYQNNTIYKDKIIEVEKIVEVEKESEAVEEEEDFFSGFGGVLITIGIMLVMAIIFVIGAKLISKFKNREEENEIEEGE